MYNSIYEHDKNGNLIYFKSLISNREYWKEYDKNNCCIHCKYSDGTEWWKEYNENNDMIYFELLLPQGERIPNSARLLKMLRKLKKFSLTFSPKAFLSVVPTVVPFGIQEFTFFRSLTTFLTTLENRVTILTLEFYLQKFKLFNSFLCKTTYSELLKEPIIYFGKKREIPLINFKNFSIYLHPWRQNQFILHHKDGGFLGKIL